MIKEKGTKDYRSPLYRKKEILPVLHREGRTYYQKSLHKIGGRVCHTRKRETHATEKEGSKYASGNRNHRHLLNHTIPLKPGVGLNMKRGT